MIDRRGRVDTKLEIQAVHRHRVDCQVEQMGRIESTFNMAHVFTHKPGGVRGCLPHELFAYIVGLQGPVGQQRRRADIGGLPQLDLYPLLTNGLQDHIRDPSLDLRMFEQAQEWAQQSVFQSREQGLNCPGLQRMDSSAG